MTILTIAPLVAYITFEGLNHFAPSLPWDKVSGVIAIVTITTVCAMALFMFSCLSEFPVNKRHMHPMWASPRLVLFMELNPIYGLMIPLVSMMRGYIFFGLFRWALNFASLCLWLAGRAILQQACCYGLEYLEGDHVSRSFLLSFPFLFSFFFFCLFYCFTHSAANLVPPRLEKGVIIITLEREGASKFATLNFLVGHTKASCLPLPFSSRYRAACSCVTSSLSNGTSLTESGGCKTK